MQQQTVDCGLWDLSNFLNSIIIKLNIVATNTFIVREIIM